MISKFIRIFNDVLFKKEEEEEELFSMMFLSYGLSLVS